ncbi:MAG: hypothetical protein NZ930_03475 [Candidatus Bipolaricaulota bacterium]|nr:hypothetical protein [Candidatus Bipolaricaulota bacterium]MDW8031486.1 hypothetical protein [Candidatus Bipolaricaulota bacterium]
MGRKAPLLFSVRRECVELAIVGTDMDRAVLADSGRTLNGLSGAEPPLPIEPIKGDGIDAPVE